MRPIYVIGGTVVGEAAVEQEYADITASRIEVLRGSAAAEPYGRFSWYGVVVVERH